MTTENQKTLEDGNMRVRGEKRTRIKKVKRELAKAEESDMTDTGILDAALEIGLKRFEKKLGL